MAIAQTDKVDKYFQAAYDAGCPRDQVERFISSGYVALPSILPFHAAARECDKRNGVREFLLDGTRGSAKSHGIIAQVGLDDCQRFDRLKFLFLRQTQKAAGEQFGDLVSRVLGGIKHTANTEKITFPNGSRMVIGGFKDEKDINKYLGIEYDGIVVEEATQISGGKHTLLLGSLRTPREDWVPRIYYGTNSGGIGHHYFYDRFIRPHQESRQISTRRFFCSYQDNPFINQEYRDYLESLTGDLAASWRDGSWDIFAGQVFKAWRHDLHVVEPFEIPKHWPRYVGIDWGSAAPWCALWVAKDPDTGRYFVYREAYMAGLHDREQARTIKEYTEKQERIQIYYADPSIWTERAHDDTHTTSTGKQVEQVWTSTADTYISEGIPVQKGDNSRMNGKRKIERLLANLPDGKPGLQIFSTCFELIRTLPALPYDPIKVEDVDTHAEDHAYDALRYALTSAREKKQEKPKPPARKSALANSKYM